MDRKCILQEKLEKKFQEMNKKFKELSKNQKTSTVISEK